ncbi:hypothetical protein [Streptomyces sp. NBC_00459]|uniref:hypothetical protein n=1 Tax=Streptomyces sp. NBC_00459 TaxID=2975749 RepID=UPI002E19AC3C
MRQSDPAVGLPAPRTEDEQQLLVAVWKEFSSHGAWPAFRLLDKRLDDLGIDVVDVLGRLPERLLVGLPDLNRPVPVGDSPVALTIAGVAQCPDSSDLVQAFLALVRAMAQLERDHEGEDSSGRTLLHSGDAVERVGLPAGHDSEELLRRAFLQAKEEPWSVYSNSGPEGTYGREGWEFAVDRNIRAYRGVVDLSDYWQRRGAQLPPSLHAGPPLLPILAHELFTPRHVTQPGLEAYVALLVLWMFEQGDGDTTLLVDPAAYAQRHDISEGRLRGVLEYASRQGAVEIVGVLGSGRLAHARLTVAGVLRAEELMRVRSNSRVRFDYAVNALVTAAMDPPDEYPPGVAPGPHWIDFVFFRSYWPHSRLYGTKISHEEVLRAAEYLGQRGLAVLQRGPLHDSEPYALELTGLGITCGSTDDVNVREFMASQPRFSIGTVNNYGGANQIGTDNTQHNTIGSTPTELAAFAQQVLASIHTIDLPEDQREQLVQDAQSLVDEASAGQPDTTRLRRLTARLRESLLQNGTDAVVQGLLSASQNLIS